MTDEANPRAVAGGNNPPEPTPFEAVKERIESLYEEARNWLDGEPVTTQEQAEGVKRLQDLIRQAEKDADAARVEENRPFDEGKAAVQAKYAPLIANTKSVTGLTVKAIDACRRALDPYLRKQEEERRAAAEAARLEAERKAKEAAEAMAKAQAAANLEAREAAEALVAEAKAAEKDASRATKPVATGLRTFWIPEITDRKAALFHYLGEQPERFEALLLELARKDVLSGKRQIPGFDVREEKRAA